MDERRRLATQLYLAERSSNTGTVNVILALVALSLTYYVATIAYVFSTANIVTGHLWISFLLPLVPAAMFSWLLLFAMLENARREYLMHLETVMKPAGTGKGDFAFVHVEAALWTPGSGWRALTTALSAVLYGVLYAAYAGYIALIGLFVSTELHGLWYLLLLPYFLHLAVGLTAFAYSVLNSRSFVSKLRDANLTSKWK
jgi:hypothetical protein